MFIFENPSHRQRLTELGILAAGESAITPADLAQRIVASPHFEEALYIIKQDFAHPLMTYGMVESQLEMVTAEAEAINSASEFYEVVKQLRNLSELPRKMGDLAEDIDLFLGYLRAIIPEQVSPEVERHLGDMVNFQGRLNGLLNEKEPALIRGLDHLKNLLQDKKTALIGKF